MDYEIKSKGEPKVEFLPLENLTKITCPKNSEGTIHLVVDIEYSFHLVIEENAHWTINVEYEKGLIIANNTIEVKEYATLKHNIICYEEIFELTANQKINLSSNAEYTSALLDVSENNKYMAERLQIKEHAPINPQKSIEKRKVNTNTSESEKSSKGQI